MLITMAECARWYPQNVSSLTEGMIQWHNLFSPPTPLVDKQQPLEG